MAVCTQVVEQKAGYRKELGCGSRVADCKSPRICSIRYEVVMGQVKSEV